MHTSEVDSLLHESQRKRKTDDLDGEQGDMDEESKTRCSCPICGAMILEEDINSHVDICLNRSAVLELVRESDKQLQFKISAKNAARPKRKR
jgi:hypothetical protein